MNIYFKEHNPKLNSYIKNIGKVFPNKTYPISFYKTDLGKQIKVKNISASCGCTSPQNEADRIQVLFTPKQGVKKIWKSVTVEFQNGETAVLQITGELNE